MSAKLKAVDTPSRSLEREKLAAAISARDAVERQLSAARTAVEQARGHRWEAQDKLDALRVAKAEESAAQSLGNQFIESIAAGGMCGLAELERPSTFDSDEAALERELGTWARTQHECEAEIPGIESALLFRKSSRRGFGACGGSGFGCCG